MCSYERVQETFVHESAGLGISEPESLRLRRLHPYGRFHDQEIAEIAVLMGRSDLPNQKISGAEMDEFQRRFQNPEDETVIGDLVERRLRSIYRNALYWYAAQGSQEGDPQVSWTDFEDYFQQSVVGVFSDLKKQRSLPNFSLKQKMELLIQRATKREARRYLDYIHSEGLGDNEDISELTERALVTPNAEQVVLSRVSFIGLVGLLKDTALAKDGFYGKRNIAITLASAVEGRGRTEIRDSLEIPVTIERVRQIVTKMLGDALAGTSQRHLSPDILKVDGVTSTEAAVLTRLREQYLLLSALRQKDPWAYGLDKHRTDLKDLELSIKRLEKRIGIDHTHPLHPQHLIDDAKPEVLARIERNPYWDFMLYGRLS